MSSKMQGKSSKSGLGEDGGGMISKQRERVVFNGLDHDAEEQQECRATSTAYVRPRACLLD